MYEFNRNIAEAPHDKTKIIVATKCGKVTASHYIVDESRWSMLHTGEVPVAWMPWPTHPGLEGYDPSAYVAPVVDSPAARATPVATRETSNGEPSAPRQPRAGGARAICQAVYDEGFTDKAAYAEECVKRGVLIGTAKARFSDIVKGSA